MTLNTSEIIGIVVCTIFTVIVIAILVRSWKENERFFQEIDNRQIAMKKEHEQLMAQLPTMTDEQKIAKIRELMNIR